MKFDKMQPEDLFLSVRADFVPSEEDLWKGRIDAARPGRYASGYPVLDAFVDLLYLHRFAPASKYARKLGFDLQDLNGFFKVLSGRSLLKWRDSYLILMAKDLLENTDMSSSEIAEWMGFSNLNSFGRWFQLYTRRQPIEWRRGFREGNKRGTYHCDD